MPEDVSRSVLQWEVDKRTLAQSIDRLEALDQTTENFADRIRRLSNQTDPAARSLRAMGDAGDDARRKLRGVADAVDDQLSGVRRLSRDVNELSDSYDKAAVSAQRLAREQQDGVKYQAYGDVESGLRAQLGLVSELGGQQFAQTGGMVAELFGAAEGLGRLNEVLPDLAEKSGLANVSLGKLGLGLGALGAVVGGVVLAFDALQDSAEESREAVLNQIEVERRLAELRPKTLTTEEIQAEIDALNESIEVRNAEYDRIVEARDRLKESLSTWQLFGDSIGIANQGLDEYNDRLEELEKEGMQDILLLINLQNALKSSTTAANDTEAAERDLAEERQQQADEYIAQQKELYGLMQLSSDQIRDRAEAIAVEKEATEDVIERLSDLQDQGEDVQDVLNTYNDRLADLSEQEALLLDRVLPLIEAREREARVIGGMTDMFKSAGDTIVSALGKAAQAVQQTRDLADQYDADTAAIDKQRQGLLRDTREKWRQDDLQDQIDHFRDLAKLDADYQKDVLAVLEQEEEEKTGLLSQAQKDRLKLQKDFAAEERRRAEEHADRLEAIRSDLDTAVEGAIMSRNVSAAADARRAAKQAVEEEQDQYEKEQERREEDYENRLEELEQYIDDREEEIDRATDKELRALKQKHDDERRTKIQAYNQELNDTKAARQRELDALRQSWRDEDRERHLHFQNQLRELGTWNAFMQTEYKDAYDATLKKTETFTDTLENKLSNAFRSLTNLLDRQPITIQRDGSGGGLTRPPKYEYGGLVGASRDIMVGEAGPEVARFLGGAWQVIAAPSRASTTVYNITVPIDARGASGVNRTDLIAAVKVALRNDLGPALQQAKARGGGIR